MLVETCKVAEAAEAYLAPFVSGKFFYNYFETDNGSVSIPTCLISGMGVVENSSHVTGASIRNKTQLF